MVNDDDIDLTQLVHKAEDAYAYFRDNSQLYEESREFIFRSTVSEQAKNDLTGLGRSVFQINTLESFISRLSGEFAKQMPSPYVYLKDSAKKDEKTIQLIKLIEGRLRYVLESSKVDNVKKAIFIETLSGGFSAGKLIIDYINPKSFDLDISFEKCFDPTLCYFDPTARKNHKGDGDFCGEVTPFTEKEFKANWPDIDISNINYTRESLTGDNLPWYWQEETISGELRAIFVADHYEKKQTKQIIYEVKIPNLKPLIEFISKTIKKFIMDKKQSQQGMQKPQPQQGMQQPQQGMQQSDAAEPFIIKVLTEEEYEAFSELWIEKTMLPKPQIIRKRETVVTEIWHYRFIRDQLLEEPQKTDFTILPIIFFDGNSHLLKNKQFTRPYHYQAVDAQKMKDICGMAMMNSIENMPQTRLLLATESLPQQEAYKESWKNPQIPSSALMYNSIGQTDDNRRLDPPTPLNLNYFGGELLHLYTELDKTIQMILGNFDQQLGLQQKELSGIAIQEGATQSNNAAMPFINNYMDSMNQIATGIVECIPKLINSDRHISIIDDDGLHQSKKVIQDEMKYDANIFEVVVKSSVNFEIQKNRTFQNLTTLIGLPDPNPWKSFFSGPAATDLLDNMTIRNQDAIKEKFIEYQEQLAQQSQDQKKMAMITNPTVAKLMETQVNAQLKQQELKLDEMNQTMNKQVEGMKVLQSFIESLVKMRETSAKLAIEESKIDAENKRTESFELDQSLKSEIAIDEHISNQLDRGMEHLYKQMELKENKNNSN